MRTSTNSRILDVTRFCSPHESGNVTLVIGNESLKVSKEVLLFIRNSGRTKWNQQPSIKIVISIDFEGIKNSANYYIFIDHLFSFWPSTLQYLLQCFTENSKRAEKKKWRSRNWIMRLEIALTFVLLLKIHSFILSSF